MDQTALRQSIVTLYGQGKYEQALPVAKRALQVVIETRGKESSDYASGLNNLALVHQSLGRYDEAEPPSLGFSRLS